MNHHTSNNFLAKLGIAAFIGVGLFYFAARWQSFQRDNLVSVIREQVKNELRVQVRSELLAELRQEFAGVMREDMRNEFDRRLAADPTAMKAVADSNAAARSVLGQRKPGFKEFLQSLWPKGQERTEILSDEDLDQYVAGDDASPEVATPVGVKKTAPRKTAGVPAATKGKAVAQKKSVAKTGTGTNQLATKPTKEIPEAIERTLKGRGSMLLPKKTLQFEPSLTYAAFSSNRLNIQGYAILPVLVIGTINADEVNRDVFINTYTMRYGLMENLQAELKVPFRGEYDRVVSTANSLTDKGAVGFGDVEFGVSRQIGWEHGAMPDLVWATAIKTPTGRSPYENNIAFGTGHWGLRNSIIAVHSSDPAVLFGNLSYTYNFARSGIENYGDIKPGDSIGYGVGTAIALSYQTAITFGFDQSVTFEMVRNDINVHDSYLNSANFKVGMNYALTEKRAIDFSLGVGLTKDSPDFTVDLRFPMTF